MQNKILYSVINDDQNNNRTIIMAKQMLDSVILNLNNSTCTVTLVSPAATPVTNLEFCGQTTSQLCKITGATLYENDKYITVSGEAVANGSCNFTDQNGEAFRSECLINLPFSCMLYAPTPSILRPEASVIASFNFTCTTLLSENTFCALANGVIIPALCSYTPITVPSKRFYPQNADTRSQASNCAVPALFPDTK